MQPYQEAGDVTRESGQTALNTIKYGLAAAVGTAGSIASRSIISSITPMLSKFVPESFAKKALNKIDPRFGEFFNKAEKEGFDFDEVKEFLQSKVEKTEEPKNAKENRSIIEQYDPELHTYIKMKLGQGMNLMEAGKKSLGHSRFKSVIEKMTKDHKTSWDAILKNVFGHSEKGQGEKQQLNPINEQQQQPANSSGGIDPQLAQLIEQGNSILKKFRGS